MAMAISAYVEAETSVLHNNTRLGLSNCSLSQCFDFQRNVSQPYEQFPFPRSLFQQDVCFYCYSWFRFLQQDACFFGISPGSDVPWHLVEQNTPRNIAGMPFAFSGLLKGQPIDLMKDHVSTKLGQMVLT